MALLGRHLLPATKREEETRKRSQRHLRTQYGLHTRAFEMRVPPRFILVGKTLAQSRIGIATGLIVVAREQGQHTELMPSRQTVAARRRQAHRAGAAGPVPRVPALERAHHRAEAPVLQGLTEGPGETDGSRGRGRLAAGRRSASPFGISAKPMAPMSWPSAAVAGAPIQSRQRAASPSDTLLLQTRPEIAGELEHSPDFAHCREVDEATLRDTYQLEDYISSYAYRSNPSSPAILWNAAASGTPSTSVSWRCSGRAT